MANDKDKDASQLDTMVSKAVESALKEALPVAAAMAAQAAAQSGPKMPVMPMRGGPTLNHGILCTVCGQYEVACKKEHVEMFVGPSNVRRLSSFPGIFINGVQYLSSSPHHKVPVPVDAVSVINHSVQLWEEGEEDLRTPRTVSHDSGTLSGDPGRRSASTHAYAGAGFRG